jgi:hypothetical protein
MKGFLDLLNQQFDPSRHSFQVETAFDFAPRPGAATSGGARMEDITTTLSPQGQFAVFEFGAALPRTRLYPQWQVTTNDTRTLGTLADPAFDPQKSVLVANVIPSSASASPTQSTGTVEIVQYEAKHVALKADTSAPSVLLLNDKWDPNWKVTVDGKPDQVLRCNYIMRGVYLQPGRHQVEFRFDPPHWTLYVSLAAIVVGIGLCGILVFTPSGSPAAGVETPKPAAAPVSAAPNPKSKIQNLKSHGPSGNLSP